MWRRIRSHGTLLLVLAVLLLTRIVTAQQRPSMVVLYWTRFPGAESCLNQRTLEKSVENRLGRKVFTSQHDADIIIRGDISRADSTDNWRVSFRMHGATGTLLGERNVIIRGKDCGSVDDAISLVFTLMVESLKETDIVQRKIRNRVEPQSAKPETQNWELDIAPAMVGSIGLLPKPVLGFALTTSLTAWRIVRSQIAVTLPQSVRVSEQNLGADIENWSIDAGACLNSLPPGRFRLEGCAAVQISEFIGSGINMSVRYQPQRWIVSAIAGPSLSLNFSNHFFLRTDLFAQVPLRSARFYYVAYTNSEGIDAQLRTLWQPWPIIPFVRLGIGVQFL
jgi:hypothetical protein